MGGLASRLRALFRSRPPLRVIMNGLDAAGKTTILYKLKLGEVVTTIPTIGFNVETVDYKNTSFVVWDVGGRCKIRALWKHYYQDASAMILVVDSNDRERLAPGEYSYETCRDALHMLLAEEQLHGLPLLVFANKQDLPNALSTEEIATALGLPQLRSRRWRIQGTCAVTGEGLYEGLDWLSSVIQPPAASASTANGASSSAASTTGSSSISGGDISGISGGDISGISGGDSAEGATATATPPAEVSAQITPAGKEDAEGLQKPALDVVAAPGGPVIGS